MAKRGQWRGRREGGEGVESGSEKRASAQRREKGEFSTICPHGSETDRVDRVDTCSHFFLHIFFLKEHRTVYVANNRVKKSEFFSNVPIDGANAVLDMAWDIAARAGNATAVRKMSMSNINIATKAGKPKKQREKKDAVCLFLLIELS